MQKYKKRVTNAIEIKEIFKVRIKERNEAIDAHKQFKLDVCKKKANANEAKKYLKIKRKYKKVWHENLPEPNPPAG